MPCWMASSKLLLDVALNSVTLATDMIRPPFRMGVTEDPDRPHSKHARLDLPWCMCEFVRPIGRLAIPRHHGCSRPVVPAPVGRHPDTIHDATSGHRLRMARALAPAQ